MSVPTQTEINIAISHELSMKICDLTEIFLDITDVPALVAAVEFGGSDCELLNASTEEGTEARRQVLNLWTAVHQASEIIRAAGRQLTA